MLEPGIATMARCVLCGHQVWLPRFDREELERAHRGSICCCECLPLDLEVRGFWNLAGRPTAEPMPFAPVAPADPPGLLEIRVMIR